MTSVAGGTRSPQTFHSSNDKAKESGNPFEGKNFESGQEIVITLSRNPKNPITLHFSHFNNLYYRKTLFAKDSASDKIHKFSWKDVVDVQAKTTPFQSRIPNKEESGANSRQAKHSGETTHAGHRNPLQNALEAVQSNVGGVVRSVQGGLENLQNTASRTRNVRAARSEANSAVKSLYHAVRNGRLAQNQEKAQEIFERAVVKLRSSPLPETEKQKYYQVLTLRMQEEVEHSLNRENRSYLAQAVNGTQSGARGIWQVVEELRARNKVPSEELRNRTLTTRDLTWLAIPRNYTAPLQAIREREAKALEAVRSFTEEPDRAVPHGQSLMLDGRYEIRAFDSTKIESHHPQLSYLVRDTEEQAMVAVMNSGEVWLFRGQDDAFNFKRRYREFLNPESIKYVRNSGFSEFAKEVQYRGRDLGADSFIGVSNVLSVAGMGVKKIAQARRRALQAQQDLSGFTFVRQEPSGAVRITRNVNGKVGTVGLEPPVTQRTKKWQSHVGSRPKTLVVDETASSSTSPRPIVATKTSTTNTRTERSAENLQNRSRAPSSQLDRLLQSHVFKALDAKTQKLAQQFLNSYPNKDIAASQLNTLMNTKGFQVLNPKQLQRLFETDPAKSLDLVAAATVLGAPDAAKANSDVLLYAARVFTKPEVVKHASVVAQLVSFLAGAPEPKLLWSMMQMDGYVQPLELAKVADLTSLPTKVLVAAFSAAASPEEVAEVVHLFKSYRERNVVHVLPAEHKFKELLANVKQLQAALNTFSRDASNLKTAVDTIISGQTGLIDSFAYATPSGPILAVAAGSEAYSQILGNLASSGKFELCIHGQHATVVFPKENRGHPIVVVDSVQADVFAAVRFAQGRGLSLKLTASNQDTAVYVASPKMSTEQLQRLFKDGGYSVDVEDMGLLRIKSEETGENLLVAVDSTATTKADFRTLASSQKFKMVNLEQDTLATARASTRARLDGVGVGAPGVNGLWTNKMQEKTSKTVSADEVIIQGRLGRVRAKIQELRERAAQGNLDAQGVLARLRRARSALEEQRRGNSNTLSTESQTRAKGGIQRSTNNYDNAWSRVTTWLAEKPNGKIDAALIKSRIAQLNVELNRGVTLWNGDTGSRGFRGPGTGIWAGYRSYLPGGEVEGAIKSFTEWFVEADLKVQQGEMTAIELAGRSYQSLVSIHPFVDGNGRTARMFMDWVLKRHGLETCTFVGSKERNVVFFFDKFNREDPLVPDRDKKTPDEAVSAVANGVSRTVGVLEAALDGN